jgi:hypothetical protein
MGIQPIDFIKKWKTVELNESAATHSHFNELCSLLGEETPTDADHDGSWYCFERGWRQDREYVCRTAQLERVRGAHPHDEEARFEMPPSSFPLY